MNARERLEVEFANFFSAREHHSGGAIGDPARIAGCDRAVFENTGGSLAMPSSVISGRMCSSWSMRMTLPFLSVRSMGTISSRKWQFFAAARGAPVAFDGEAILLFARNFILRGEQLRGFAHHHFGHAGKGSHRDTLRPRAADCPCASPSARPSDTERGSWIPRRRQR